VKVLKVVRALRGLRGFSRDVVLMVPSLCRGRPGGFPALVGNVEPGAQYAS
jgi:hypothetical protein